MRTVLPKWRQYTMCESLYMKDQLFSNLSIDNVTIFGMRPPELRFVRHIKMYFRWFHFKKSKIMANTFSKQVSILESVIKDTLIETMWIDGCGRHVFIRPNALNEILVYLQERSNTDFYGSTVGNAYVEDTLLIETEMPKEFVIKLFKSINQCFETSINRNNIQNDDLDIATNFMNVSNVIELNNYVQEPFPVIWFSSIKPSQGSRWLLHLLLSLGEFDNEYSLFCKPSLKECFISCKLLSTEAASHENDIKELLKKYIIEQLNYIPGGSKQFDRNVIAAYQALQNEVLLNVPLHAETPPVLYTQLQHEVSEDTKLYIKTLRKRVLNTTLIKLQAKSTIQLPSLDELLQATKMVPFTWNIFSSMPCGATQSIESYTEQLDTIKYSCQKLKLFLCATPLINKNIILCGGPGVGKTTLLQILIIYAASLGLNINLSSVMSERSCELGGLHLSKMFCIPTIRNLNPSIIAEKAVCTLLRQPKQLTLLQKLEILAIDEFGQVSAELLSTLDIILRTIRKNSLFMGGVFIIATMDNMQLPPVNGRPPLLSPHMISSFSFKMLSKSVRASQDSNLQEIQNLTRLSYEELQPLQINRFRFLIETHCTHVDDFNNELITADKLRLFGKRSAKEHAENELLQLKRQEFPEYIECRSEDFECTLESQWDKASPTTIALLSRKVKEPQKLCFYPNATYEITFNCENQFSQGQIALLATMPTINEIEEFAPISIYIAPDGCKTFPSSFDSSTLLQQGWSVRSMTKCPEHSVYLGNGVEAKRRQYGLRHRIASTIHAAMGQDLEHVVTKVTDIRGDPSYHLWEKEQVVVLLSRTNFAKDIIFVGDRTETSKALSELLTKRSQYTEYTNSMLKTLSSQDNHFQWLQTLNLNLYPYRPIDFDIPSESCGFVYLLKSLSPYMHQTTYIGETKNIVKRVRQHNQLRGSKSTNNPLLLPWGLVAFITGFSLNTSLVRKQFERLWKVKRDEIKNRYNRCLTIEEMCKCAKLVMETYPTEELRYIQCCSFDESTTRV